MAAVFSKDQFSTKDCKVCKETRIHYSSKEQNKSLETVFEKIHSLGLLDEEFKNKS